MRILRNDWMDVISAASLGLRVRKWAVALPGVAAGFVWWGVFGYVALLVQGWSLAQIWRVFGPLPWMTTTTLGGPIGTLLWVVADIGSVAAWLLASAAIAKITYEQLKGNEFVSWTEAWTFSLSRWKALILTPFTLLVGAGLALFFLWIISLLVGAWQPLAGILFVFALPAAAALLYLCMLSCLAVIVGPAVVASSNSLTLETLFEILSLHASQGRRSWFYSLLSGLLASIHTAALGLFLAVASLFSTWVLDLGHEGMVGRMFKAASACTPRIAAAINGVPGLFESVTHAGGAGSRVPQSYALLAEPISFGTIFLAFWLLVLFFLLGAQFVTTYTTCSTTSYIVLRQLKDEQNLLEEDLGDE